MSFLRSSTTQAVREVRNRLSDVRPDMGSDSAGPLPDFVIVGAMKAGTTSLAGNLKQHPRIFMPRREVRFFNEHWHEGVDWYRAHFRDGAEMVVGEKTPEYMRANRYMRRLRRVLPNAKIIVLLREPVARLLSEMNHRMQSGTLPVVDRIDEAYVRNHVLGDPLRGRRMLDRGFYAKHIRENIRPYFPRDRVLISVTDASAASIDRGSLRESRLEGQLTGEDASEHTVRALDEICRFLGIEPMDAPLTYAGVRVHRAEETPGARKLLFERYEEHNRRLFDLLGYEIPGWREEIAVGEP